MKFKQIKYFNTFILVFLALGTVVLYAGVDVIDTDPNAAKDEEANLFSIFQDGGMFMLPILLCCLAGIAYWVERLINLQLSAVLPPALKQKYNDVMAGIMKGEKNPDMLKTLCTGGKSEGELLFNKFLRRDLNSIRDAENILQEYCEVSKWRLQRNVKPLGLIATICPLLGLLGTVIGIIQAFDEIGVRGGDAFSTLSEGITVALYTTAFGLIVAIPVSIFYHQMMEKASRINLALYHMLHELTLAWLSDKPQGVEIEL